jgi:hypothetical protein
MSKRAFETSSDILSTIKSEFGNEATLADWQTLKQILQTQAQATKFITEVGIPLQSANGPCNNFLVSNGGQLRLGNGLWTFVARHDGKVPNNWLVLDSISNHSLDLGRWSYRSQALVFIRDTPNAANAAGDSPVLALANYDGTNRHYAAL